MGEKSDSPFREKVENIRDEREAGERDDFQEEVPIRARWGIVAGAFIVGGVLGAIANPTEPVLGFFVIGFLFSGVIWAFATRSGKIFRNVFMEIMKEAQQQQQTSSTSKPKVVCSSCGWQNPKGNNYCHDCGEKLGS